MTGPGGGRLIGLVDFDLPDHRLVLDSDCAATFVPVQGGPSLKVRPRVERRFLGRTEIAQFQTATPVHRWGPAHLRVHHTGGLRRQGPEVRAEKGSEEATRLAGDLSSDADFAMAALSLDFTRFDIDLDGERCVATVELMGATLVSIAFPPIRSYVRLHRDQKDALVGSLTALGRVVI